ncbi:MAG: hypothetical protein AAFO94_16075, partial [Bacteroidota bacterium]
MSTEQFININIEFDKPSASYISDEKITGKLILKCREDILLDECGIVVVLSTRGRVDVTDKIIDRIIDKNVTTLKANEIHEFAFGFQAPKLLSFKGINLQFTWCVQSHLVINQRDQNKVRSSIRKSAG